MRTKSAQNGFSLLVLYVLLCMHCGSFAQSKSLRQYYYWTNQAELAICDSNYQRANEYFAKAFTYKFPFASHLRTAYHLNTHITHNEDNILHYAYMFCLRGDGEYAIAEYWRADTNNAQLIDKLQLMADTTHCQSHDTIVQKKLEKIIETDQSYRHHRQPTAQEDSLNRSNIKAIKELFKTYPHLNEVTIGNYFWMYLGVPALHFVQAGNYSLQKVLKKQVNKGELEASAYMSLEDNYYWYKKMKRNKRSVDPNQYAQNHLYCYEIGNTLFITYPTNIKRVNRNRKKLGVAETFEEMAKKRIWEFQNDYNWHVVNHLGYGSDEETAQKAERVKQEIDAEHAKGNFLRMYYDKK